MNGIKRINENRFVVVVACSVSLEWLFCAFFSLRTMRTAGVSQGLDGFAPVFAGCRRGRRSSRSRRHYSIVQLRSSYSELCNVVMLFVART